MSTPADTESAENAPEQQDGSGTTAPESGEISDWQFRGAPPTREQVLELLRTMSPCYGVEYVDFADFVQALPQRLRAKVPHPTNPKVTVDEYIEAWTLYMTVAGRIAMLNAVAERNEWRVDFQPEPNTPTGIPGMLQYDERVVYREYVVIDALAPDRTEAARIGSKPGTAWVPSSGGGGAAASNPFEVVETSARGRAIAAWGIGILPGSGVASVEEMHSMSLNQRHQEQQQNGGNGNQQRRRRPSREELQGRVMQSMEEFRQRLGSDEETFTQQIVQYLTGIGAKDVFNESTGRIRWENVTDGHLQLLANKIGEHLRDLASREFGGEA